MATTFLAEDPIQGTFLIPGTNTPGNGVQLFCYAAASSTKTTVYKDNAAATPWTNPIVLDSGGNLPAGAQVWQSQGQSMKYVYAPSNDTDPPASPYRTLDNMPGVNDVTAQTGVEWLTGPTPTFVSGTQFTLVGDQTAIFTKGRRVKTTNTGGTVYSTIFGSAFGANTTVNIVNDASALDAGLSAVSYGLFDPANVSISPSEIYRKGASVSSATNGTTDIWGIVGDYVHVTGTTGIRMFSSAPYAGAERTVIFDAALTLFSSAALGLPGNANYSTAANDRAQVRAESVSTAIVTFLQAAGGVPSTAQACSAVFAGPSTGANAPATFRNLVGAESAFVLLSSKIANSSAALSFTTSDINWAAFDEYEFHLINLTLNAADALRVRFSADGGNTFISTGVYSGTGSGVDSTTTTVNTQAQSAVSIALMQNLNSQAGYHINGKLTLYSPQNTSFVHKMLASQLTYYDTNSAIVTQIGGGILIGASTTVNGLTVFPAAGTTFVSSGAIRVYGLLRA